MQQDNQKELNNVLIASAGWNEKASLLEAGKCFDDCKDQLTFSSTLLHMSPNMLQIGILKIQITYAEVCASLEPQPQTMKIRLFSSRWILFLRFLCCISTDNSKSTENFGNSARNFSNRGRFLNYMFGSKKLTDDCINMSNLEFKVHPFLINNCSQLSVLEDM